MKTVATLGTTCSWKTKPVFIVSLKIDNESNRPFSIRFWDETQCAI